MWISQIEIDYIDVIIYAYQNKADFDYNKRFKDDNDNKKSNVKIPKQKKNVYICILSFVWYDIRKEPLDTEMHIVTLS
jgi:hypothetical protein